MLTVQDNVVVSLDYTLRLDDGQVVDSSDGHGPLQYLQGRGNIIPGLERALYGLTAGASQEVVVAPADGYGEFNSDLLETLPRSVFPVDWQLEKGMGFRMRTENGQTVTAYVDTVGAEEVVVNLNHPLAGKTLHFDVRIAELREATPEEIAQGAIASECGCGCGGSCGSCGEDCEGGCSCEDGACDCEEDDEGEDA